LNFGQETARFIGGVGRSGTTLLVDMLGLHHSFSPVYETDFVLPFLEWVRSRNTVQLKNATVFSKQWAAPLPHRPNNKREHEKYHHGNHYVLFTKRNMEERIDRLFGEESTDSTLVRINRLIHELFDCHCRCDKKQLWINKTPLYVMYLTELKHVFPKMKFIHCIRDGRDVACSVTSCPWGPSTHLDAAVWWKFQIMNARLCAPDSPGEYMEVKYEDLLVDPEASLERIFAFLNVENESCRLLQSYSEKKGGIRLETSRVGNWKSEFTKEEKAKFWDLAGDLLSDLGYDQ
jgi:hypothetical protein